MTLRALVDDRMLTQLMDFFPDECTIQIATTSYNAFGEGIKAWGSYAGHVNIPCRRAWTGGGEYRRPNLTYATNVFTIVLRGYYNTITTEMRVKMGSSYYNILLIEYDGQDTMTRITAELVV